MRRTALRCFALALALVCGAALAACAGGAAQGIVVSKAFAYACAMGGDCGVYLTLTNSSQEADALTGARTEVAGSAELHTLKMTEQGSMKMERVERMAAPPRATVALAPGGQHLMLTNLTRELKTGDTFALTLLFETGGEQTVQVVVMPEN